MPDFAFRAMPFQFHATVRTNAARTQPVKKWSFDDEGGAVAVLMMSGKLCMWGHEAYLNGENLNGYDFSTGVEDVRGMSVRTQLRCQLRCQLS